MKELTKNIIISGCSRGLGRALAVGFAERGHQVAGCARSVDPMATLAEELGDPHHFAAVDVVDDIAVAEFIKQSIDAHGPPDLLINNAAIINQNAPLWQVPAEEFSQVIDINIKGLNNILRHSIPPMITAGSGVIVNLSSGWGRSTSPDVAPYCATKWAVEGLTSALAQELPSGLAAIALNPGVIDTEMLRTCFGEGAEGHRSAEQWATTAMPFLEALSAADNGAVLTAP